MPCGVRAARGSMCAEGRAVLPPPMSYKASLCCRGAIPQRADHAREVSPRARPTPRPRPRSIGVLI